MTSTAGGAAATTRTDATSKRTCDARAARMVGEPARREPRSRRCFATVTASNGAPNGRRAGS